MSADGRPHAVLGLCSFTHDSAAALLVDGALVGFVEEERLSAVKHTRAYPARAVEWLLRRAGITADEVTEVAYNFHPLRSLFTRAVPLTATGFTLDPVYFLPRVLSSQYTRLSARFAAEICPPRNHQVIIGYSFWGFLGPGVTDTPDGGRSHRRTLIDVLDGDGHQVVFLQHNRDLYEAGDDLGGRYVFDPGLPDIDVLFLEWRWPIPDRNTTPCGTPGHTCDLHRQRQLLDHYTFALDTPTLIWDKDRRLAAGDPLRRRPGVIVCEAALSPTPGARRLLFPVRDTNVDAADPAELAARPRPVSLAYVGNQYDRDDAFDRFFAPAAARFRHVVAGKWTSTGRWPHVTFTGRIPFPRVSELYGEALATVLLLPDRYALAGQMTQRIFEAVLSGCVPLAPATIRHVDMFVPPQLIVNDGTDMIRTLHWLRSIRGSRAHADLIAECLRRLEVFRISLQRQALCTVLTELSAAGAVRQAGRQR